MAKVSPYYFKDMPLELIDFKDEVSVILNYGKYQVKTLIDAGTPTWTGFEGEQCFCYISSGGGQYEFRTYYYVNSGWRYTLFVGAT